MTLGIFSMGALAFMRGEERLSAPAKIGFWSRALAPEIEKPRAKETESQLLPPLRGSGTFTIHPPGFAPRANFNAAATRLVRLASHLKPSVFPLDGKSSSPLLKQGAAAGSLESAIRLPRKGYLRPPPWV